MARFDDDPERWIVGIARPMDVADQGASPVANVSRKADGQAEPVATIPRAAASIEAEPAPEAAGALLEALAALVPEHRKTYRDRPARRPLRIYSFDPMLANTLEPIGPGVVTVEIPWEPLWEGPRGARVVVTDYDSSRRIDDKPAPGFYEPVNLDMTRIAIQGGLPPQAIAGLGHDWIRGSRFASSGRLPQGVGVEHDRPLLGRRSIFQWHGEELEPVSLRPRTKAAEFR